MSHVGLFLHDWRRAYAPVQHVPVNLGLEGVFAPARILIVDDERSNRDLLEAMLTPEGFLLDTASNGEEALAMIARQAPDLVLIDVMMPGMDGYQVTSRIKGNAATRNIPVIMLTAPSDSSARTRGLGAGAENYLTKPIDRAELGMCVRNLLRRSAHGDLHNRDSQTLEAAGGSRMADLSESERLYRTTFETAPIGIGHIGLDGRWLRVNQRLCDLLGYTCDELLEISAQALMDPEDVARQVEPFGQITAGVVDRLVVDEQRFRRRDGSSVWCRVNVSVHRDAKGEPRQFIAVIEDVTERRMLEAQVRQSGKMDAIGQLASGVAHDFNNLLTVILGFTELVIQDVTVGEQHRDDLGEIVKAAQRAASLTKQLLAFGRQQMLHAVPVDVNELITEMVGMFTRVIGVDIEISLDLAPTVALALMDRGQLAQVVMNLVVNARDAMPTGGTLAIETRDVMLENSTFHDETVIAGEYVMLAITDTGSGMSLETRRRLFEPFYTTKEIGKGTGLGLSTAYGIVKQSKGHFWVYSELNRGTTFKVYLPRAVLGAATPSVGTAIIAPVYRGTETVLLVDDEVGVRRLSTRFLEHAGYRVLQASNSGEAEQLFADHPGIIDLLVTDVVMPGCGGPELLARLRIRTPDLRVLFMSGYTEQSGLHGMELESGVPFVQKPFTAAQFVRQVREALDR